MDHSAGLTSVTPDEVPDAVNPECGDYELSGFKPNEENQDDPSGTYELVLGKTVTIVENQAETGIDWTSTLGIDKVIIKGGPNANVYTYDPPAESFGDTGLTTPDNPNGETEGPYGLSHVEFCYDLELEVSKTAVPSFDRAFDWTIAKSVDKSSVTTTDNTVTFNYTVDATKSAGVDSNFKVTGLISVFNPFDDPEDVVIADDIQGDGDSCTVEGANEEGNWTIPAASTASFAYSCTLPTKADGTNRVTISTVPQDVLTALTQDDEPLDSFDAPFVFGAPTTVVNNSVDVTDAFNGEAAALLEGGDDITESKSFSYSRTVNVPTTGCTTFPNIAHIASPDGLGKDANASVEVCRQTPPPPPPPPPPPATPPATPPAPAAVTLGSPLAKASLKVDKTGPRAATAGQVVTYTIRVRNTGKVKATSVVLRDLLPGGYSLSGKAKGASFKAGALTWKVGTLAPGASKTVKASFRIDRTIGGRRCNVASASASGVATVRDTACTRIAAVAGAVVPAVTG